MLIHVIRHAHAGSRKAWSGDDRVRPLSHRGEAEAQAIALALAEAGVDQLWSSGFTRCSQTLEPLARKRSLVITEVDELSEGGSGARALDLLLAAAADGHVVAASSHGDVIPDLVAAAVERGATLDGPRSPKKGARYELTVVDGRVAHLAHVESPRGDDG